jgi:hypothetical protein
MGLIPVVAYRLSPAALDSRQLFDPTPAAWISGIVRLVGQVLPLLFDLGATPLGVAVAGVLVVACALSVRDAITAWRANANRGAGQPRPSAADGKVYLALLWLTVPTVALVSNQIVDVHGFRYLMPLYSAVTVSLAVLCVTVARSRSWRLPLGVAVAGSWIAHGALSLAEHRNDAVDDLPVGAIVEAARAAGVDAVVAPYWECYRLGFLTARQVACVPYGGPVRDELALDRWRRQTEFAALVPDDRADVILATARSSPTADRVDTYAIDDWTLLVVRPASPVGWDERRAVLADRLAQITDGEAGDFSDWSALR